MFKNLRRNCFTRQVIADIVLKFRNFRYHGNKGQSGVNFKDTVKLADPGNPRSGAIICDVTDTRRIMADLVLNFSNFRFHDNKTRSK